MTRQGPQLTPPGGVHPLRLPGGARPEDEASASATPGQLALSPFSGPAPGPALPTAPAQSGAHATSGVGTVLQQAPTVSPASEDGDWAVLPIVALVIVATGLAWRAIRR